MQFYKSFVQICPLLLEISQSGIIKKIRSGKKHSYSNHVGYEKPV